MTAQASPQTLLEGINLFLTPTISLTKTPSTLQFYAHLQLLSARICVEAARALAEHERIQNELVEEEVPPEEWESRGALSRRDAKKLRKLVERNGTGGVVKQMLPYSFSLRKQHILYLMSLPTISPGRVFPLVELYFPSRQADEDFEEYDEPAKPQLYIRMMSEEEWMLLETYRTEIMEIYEAFERDHAAGQRPELPASAGLMKAFEVFTRNMPLHAERIVKDAEELEAMFASNESVEGAMATATSKEVIADEHGASNIGQLFQQADDAALSGPSESRSSLHTSPSASRRKRERDSSGSRRSPPPTHRPKPTTAPHPDDDDTFFEPQSPQAGPSSPSSPARRAAAAEIQQPPTQPQSRRVSKPTHPPPVPDYTKPVAKMGANVSKAQLKPFDQKVLKRARTSADASKAKDPLLQGTGDRGAEGPSKRAKVERKGRGEGADAKEESGAARRTVLAERGGLQNSQSSGESLQSRERKRLEKGKERADGRHLERKKDVPLE